MQATRFERRSTFDASVDELWAFHLRPDALAVLSPPATGFQVDDPGQGVAEGSVVRMRLGFWPLSSRWHALHCNVVPEESFTDVALQSPFPYWVHVHSFRAAGSTRSELSDVVWYVQPRWLDHALGRLGTRLALRLLFSWRHRRTRTFLGRSQDSTEAPSMSPLSSDLLGSGVKA